MAKLIIFIVIMFASIIGSAIVLSYGLHQDSPGWIVMGVVFITVNSLIWTFNILLTLEELL